MVLVFAADLEQVEEVCGAGADANEVLVCRGSWVGDGGYDEVSWALFGKCSMSVDG